MEGIATEVARVVVTAAAPAAVDITTVEAQVAEDVDLAEMVIEAPVATVSVVPVHIVVCGARETVIMEGEYLLTVGADIQASMPLLQDIAGLTTVAAFSSLQSQQGSFPTSLWAT